MGDKPRAVVTQPEDGCIDIPHTTEAEAALVQEMRERCSMLKAHVADPEAVQNLEQLDALLEWLKFCMNETEEYECVCDENHGL